MPSLAKIQVVTQRHAASTLISLMFFAVVGIDIAVRASHAIA